MISETVFQKTDLLFGVCFAMIIYADGSRVILYSISAGLITAKIFLTFK